MREVLRFPHPDLKRRCPAVGEDDVAALVEDLLGTMSGYPRCVGIAAPQIGALVRVCVVDCSLNPKLTGHHGRLVLVDPEIVDRSEAAEVAREGCLSIPELTANVRRATEIVVEASEPSGQTRVVRAEGFEARCLQHEIDHLDGILFLDRVDSLTSDVFQRKRRSAPPSSST